MANCLDLPDHELISSGDSCFVLRLWKNCLGIILTDGWCWTAIERVWTQQATWRSWATDITAYNTRDLFVWNPTDREFVWSSCKLSAELCNQWVAPDQSCNVSLSSAQTPLEYGLWPKYLSVILECSCSWTRQVATGEILYGSMGMACATFQFVTSAY